jgi:hypothetical protein
MKPTSYCSRVLSHLPILWSILLMTLGTTLSAQTTPPASADPRLDELQKQMRDLDAKMNRLLGLLEGKSQTTPPIAAPGTVPGTTLVAGSKPKMPGAFLDFWLTDGVSKELPATPAIVTLKDTTQPFGFGNCLEQPAIAAYKQKMLGFRWRGLIQIEEAGQHLIVLDFKAGDQPVWIGRRSLPMGLFTKFTIAGIDVVNGGVAVRGENSVEAKTAVVDLQVGFYEFSFWVVPKLFSEGDVPNYPTLSVELKLKSPSDSAPVIIDADRISHYE